MSQIHGLLLLRRCLFRLPQRRRHIDIITTTTSIPPHGQRSFTTFQARLYDGVYKELRDKKLQKPWLEALEELKAGAQPTTGAGTASGTNIDIDVMPKRMSDSFHRVVLPLARDRWLVDGYVNASGQLRLGTLFQDLDALAGLIAYKHTGPHPTTVTAAVDRISIIHPLESFCDLELSGFVSYVGNSSMEVSLEARKLVEGEERVKGEEGLLLTCAFTMVALDPRTKKAMKISPLIVETPEEKAIFRRGEAYKLSKKALSTTSLTKQTPNDEESDLIHQMHLSHQTYKDPRSHLRKPQNTTYMSDTTISSTQIMQPQYRNRHSFMIFGGYLMKHTMELAFCCCSAFSHSRPRFLSLDPSTFDAPVPVGSILYLTAVVAYTEPVISGKGGEGLVGSRVQVRVESKVRDVEHGKVDETGVFNYTFFVEREVEVMPVTYSEFMKFIDARRRAQQQKALIGIEMDDGTKERVTE